MMARLATQQTSQQRLRRPQLQVRCDDSLADQTGLPDEGSVETFMPIRDNDET
jgi:hypothetical protein